MLRECRDHAHIVIHNDSRDVNLDVVKRGLIAGLIAKGLTNKQVAEVFGIHRNTVAKYASPDPHTEAVFGSGEWSPKCQDQPAKSCDRCGGNIKRGSSLYCAACHSSGHEAKLRKQRFADSVNAAYDEIEAECKRAEKRKTLAERRQKRVS